MQQELDMRSFSAKPFRLAALLLAASFLWPATSANAATYVLANSAMLAAFQAISSQNQCTIFTYDHNGNITAKTNQPYGTTATWGSSAYGCFNWASS
jgi:hypothetical protein